MVIFHSYVSLPEGTYTYAAYTFTLIRIHVYASQKRSEILSLIFTGLRYAHWAARG